jgi:hypothetical protein
MQLISVPICVVQSMLSDAPLASVVLAAVMAGYYWGTRALLRRFTATKRNGAGVLRGPAASSIESAAPAKESPQKSPKELYDSTVRFFIHAAEFLVLLGLLGWAAQSVGLMPHFGAIFNHCISNSGR